MQNSDHYRHGHNSSAATPAATPYKGRSEFGFSGPTEAEDRRIEQLLADDKGVNGPCLVWVPVVDAETGLGHHQLDMAKTLQYSRAWGRDEVLDYMRQNDMPRQQVFIGFDYKAASQRMPGHQQNKTPQQATLEGLLAY